MAGRTGIPYSIENWNTVYIYWIYWIPQNKRHVVHCISITPCTTTGESIAPTLTGGSLYPTIIIPSIYTYKTLWGVLYSVLVFRTTQVPYVRFVNTLRTLTHGTRTRNTGIQYHSNTKQIVRYVSQQRTSVPRFIVLVVRVVTLSIVVSWGRPVSVTPCTGEFSCRPMLRYDTVPYEK